MIRRVDTGSYVAKQRSARDVYSYFSKATGQKTGKPAKSKETPKEIHKPAQIDIKDRIKMSREMREEPEAAMGKTKEKNPVNMDALLNKIKMAPHEKNEGTKNMSLAEKLEMISMKSAGHAW